MSRRIPVLTLGALGCLLAFASITCGRPPPPPPAPVAAPAPTPEAAPAPVSDLPQLLDEDCRRRASGGYQPFDKEVAKGTLINAETRAQACTSNEGEPKWSLAVSFAPYGCLHEAHFVPPLPTDRETAACILEAFRDAQVSAFRGSVVTLLAGASPTPIEHPVGAVASTRVAPPPAPAPAPAASAPAPAASAPAPAPAAPAPAPKPAAPAPAPASSTVNATSLPGYAPPPPSRAPAPASSR